MSSNPETPTTVKTPWYYSTPFIIAGLFFCFPVGLIFMWAGKRFSMLARVSITVIIGLLFVIGMTAPDNNKHYESSATRSDNIENSASIPVQRPRLNVPVEQSSLAAVVREYAKAYRDANNELKKSAVRSARRAAIEEALKGIRSVTNWTGRLSEMGTTSEGDAYITIKLENSDVEVKTWNNSFSDISDLTLIKHSSALYNNIANFNKGDRVQFSGKFLADKMDFIREGSLTEEGAMLEPEFLFRFSEVKNP